MTRRKPKGPTRTRAIPVQIYLSPDERALLLGLAAKKQISVAELVRGWIVASASARGWLAKDPRQLGVRE